MHTQRDAQVSMGAQAAVAAAEASEKLLARPKARVAPTPPGFELAALDAVPTNLLAVREALETSALAALGVPPSLVGTGNGAAHREDYRRTIRAAVAPLAALAAEELGDKLGLPDYSLSTAVLGGHDVAAIARAIKALTEAGVALSDALEAVGI